MRKTRTAVLRTVFLVMWHGLSWGSVTGSIAGTVKDQTDRVIVGVTVVATNATQGIQTKTVTDPNWGNSGNTKIQTARLVK